MVSAPEAYIGKILVVDDEEINLDILTCMLEERRYFVQTARSGQSALEKVQEFLPDLIVLDIVMPDIEGYEVCRQFKEKPETCAYSLIIFISALDESED